MHKNDVRGNSKSVSFYDWQDFKGRDCDIHSLYIQLMDITGVAKSNEIVVRVFLKRE